MRLDENHEVARPVQRHVGVIRTTRERVDEREGRKELATKIVSYGFKWNRQRRERAVEAAARYVKLGSEDRRECYCVDIRRRRERLRAIDHC